MHTLKICVTILLVIADVLADNVLNYITFLDVQFLNLTDEVRISQNISHKFETIHTKEVVIIITIISFHKN